MKTRMKLLCGALCLSLLAGCGGPGAATPTPEPTPDPDDLVYQLIGIQRDQSFLTINGEDVPAEEYLFWLSNNVMLFQQYYGMFLTDDSWETDGDNLKSYTLELVKSYSVARQKAAEYGVTLTDEQQAEVDDYMAELMEDQGGEDGLRAYLENFCITLEGFSRINEVTYLYDTLEEQLKADMTVTDAEIDELVEQEIRENGMYAAKHILLQTRRETETGYEELSDEEKTAVYARMEGFLTQLRQAEDPAALFDQLMNEYSEDGRDSATGNLYYPDGYDLVYQGEMVTEFEEAALALEVGEISDIVTTDYGYHIIQRIPLNEESLRSTIAENAADYKLGEMSSQWLEEAVVETTQAYEELDPKAFCSALEELVETREIARALENNEATPAG